MAFHHLLSPRGLLPAPLRPPRSAAGAVALSAAGAARPAAAAARGV